jgi:hypothetical protein
MPREQAFRVQVPRRLGRTVQEPTADIVVERGALIPDLPVRLGRRLAGFAAALAAPLTPR